VVVAEVVLRPLTGSDGSHQSRDGDEPESLGGEDRDTDERRASLVRPVN